VAAQLVSKLFNPAAPAKAAAAPPPETVQQQQQQQQQQQLLAQMTGKGLKINTFA
jgi:hypothetical protein